MSGEEPRPPEAPVRRQRSGKKLLVAAAGVFLLVALYNLVLGRSLGLQEVHLYGEERWTAGTTASVRVVLLRHDTQQPIPNAVVRVSLSVAKRAIVDLASGRTDAAGTLETSFPVPDEEGQARLLVVAESGWGRDFVDQPIRLAPGYRVFASPDRPAYRAGQRVRLHAWVRRAGSGRPAASREVSVCAFTPDDVLFCSRAARTDANGSALADVELAPGAPPGDYRLKVACGPSAIEFPVTVLPGQEPPFPISLRADAPYAVPGSVLHGTLSATDMLGGPLSEAPARVWLANAAGRAISWSAGKLDSQGQMRFGLPAPRAEEIANLRLQAEVTGPEQRTARATMPVAITPRPIQLAAIPEAGALVPGVQNRVFLVARYPDGAPAAGASLRYDIAGASGGATASAFGVATVALTPREGASSIALSASDTHGRTGTFAGALPTARVSDAEWALRERYRLQTRRPRTSPPGAMLLRPDRGIYSPGATVRVELYAPGRSGYVYLDGWAGQTAFTQVIPLRSGHGAAAVKLPAQLAGTVWLRAYPLGPWGDVARAQRAIFVQPAAAPAPELRLTRTSYEPGQLARVIVAGGDAAVSDLKLVQASPDAAGAPVVGPRWLSAPALPGAPAPPAGTRPDPADPAQQEAALAALALAAPPPGTTLLEDDYAAKQAQLPVRKAASWLWLRWAVLLVLTALWLAAARPVPRTTPREPAGAGAPAPDGGAGAPAPDDAAGAPPASLGSVLEHGTVRSLLRFLLMAGAVALGATVLFGLIGRQPSRPPADPGDRLAFALQREAQAQMRSVVESIATLPQPMPAAPAAPDVLFWAPELRPAGEEPASRVFYVPTEPGDYALACTSVTQEGVFARTVAPLHVDGDFAVEFDPPAFVRAGDVIAGRVRVRNLTSGPLPLSIKLMVGAGLMVGAPPVRVENLAAGAAITRSFQVRALDRPGTAAMTMVVAGPRYSALVRRELRILPAGAGATVSRAGLLREAAAYDLDLPRPVREATLSLAATPQTLAAAVLPELLHASAAGACHWAATLQVAALALPTGTRNAHAGTDAQVTAALERAYQELLACRDQDGGFALFPGGEADVAATAYAAAALESAQGILPGARAVARRARVSLHSTPESRAPAAGGTQAAFAAWCLQDADAAARLAEPNQGHASRGRRSSRPSRKEDAYVLALLLGAARSQQQDASAPAAAGAQPAADVSSLADRLAALAATEGKESHWTATRSTAQGLLGEESAPETTALAVLALAPEQRYRSLVEQGCAFLAGARTASGTWGSAVTTALALRALAAAFPQTAAGPVSVSVNGQIVGSVKPGDAPLELGPSLAVGANTVALQPRAAGTTVFYVLNVTTEGAPEQGKGRSVPDLQAGYAPLHLSPGQATLFSARLWGEAPRPVCLEVPLPAGFHAARADLDALVENGQVAAYRIDARRATLYVDAYHRKRWVSFHLVAPARSTVLAPAPAAYPAADPSARAYGPAERLVVQ